LKHPVSHWAVSSPDNIASKDAISPTAFHFGWNPSPLGLLVTSPNAVKLRIVQDPHLESKACFAKICSDMQSQLCTPIRLDLMAVTQGVLTTNYPNTQDIWKPSFAGLPALAKASVA
jgi:hypothetical protein